MLTRIFLAGRLPLAIILAVVPPIAGDQPAGPDAALTAKVDEYVRPYVEMRDFSGAVLIAKDGRVLVRKAYGMANFELGVPNTPETRFRIASLTKPFTAAAVLTLRAQGKLALSDPLMKFWPDFPHGDKITVEHLLSHRSGIPDYGTIPGHQDMLLKTLSLREAVDWLKGRPLDFAPGSQSRYSNSGYVVLAYLIEKLSGRSYEEYLRETIWRPLGMNNTGEARHEPLVKDRAAGYSITETADRIENAPWSDLSLKVGAGSLYSTVDDLYLWYQAIKARKFFWDGPKLEPFGWGVRNWFDRTAITQDGSADGVAAHISAYFIREDMCVIILSNIDAGAINRMKMDLAAMVFGKPYEMPKVRSHVTVAADSLWQFEGRYQFAEDTTFEVKVRDGHLDYIWGGHPLPLTSLGGNEFFARDSHAYETLRFVTEGGRVTHVLFGKDKVCKKVG